MSERSARSSSITAAESALNTSGRTFGCSAVNSLSNVGTRNSPGVVLAAMRSVPARPPSTALNSSRRRP